LFYTKAMSRDKIYQAIKAMEYKQETPSLEFIICEDQNGYYSKILHKGKVIAETLRTPNIREAKHDGENMAKRYYRRYYT